MEIKLSHIDSFIAVVEHGGFAAAAKSLGLTASAVSKHVTALEERLGVRLFDRSTRHVNTTALGQAYFDRVAPVMGNLQDAERALNSAATIISGQIRVSAPMDFGRKYIPDIVSSFSVLWPQVTFDIELTDRYVDIIAERFDIALRIGALDSSSLVAKQLASFNRVLVAAPSYLARTKVPINISDLPKYDCINFSFARESSWGFTQALTSDASVPRERHRVNNGDLMCALVLAGEGIAYLPTFIVQEYLEQGSLVNILPDLVDEKLNLHAVFPHRRLISATNRLFIDHLSDFFDGLGD